MQSDLTWLFISLSSLAAIVLVYGAYLSYKTFRNRNISRKHSLYYDDAGIGTGSTMYHTDSVWEGEEGEEEAFVNDNHSADGIIDKSLSFTKYGSLRMP